MALATLDEPFEQSTAIKKEGLLYWRRVEDYSIIETTRSLQCTYYYLH